MRRILSMVATTLLLVHSTARAEPLTVTIGSLNLSPGETKPLDVLISGDGSVPLNNFNFELRISTSGARQLYFVDPATVDQGLAFLTDSSYILSGHGSTANDSGILGTVGSWSGPNDKFNGSDGVTGETDYVTVGSSSKLLTRLWVTAATDLAPQATDSLTDRTFTVSLFRGDDYPMTEFRDASFATYDYTSSSGTVSVVPEPATVIGLITGGICLAGIIGYRSLRRRWGIATEQPEPFFDEEAEREPQGQ